MNKLDEEKEMVRKMKDSGMTLAEVATELEKSIYWVFSRYDEHYIPDRSREESGNLSPTQRKGKVLNEEEKELLIVKEIEKRLAKLEESRPKVDKELNYSPHRTEEELEEYRKKRDKEVKVPRMLPEI